MPVFVSVVTPYSSIVATFLITHALSVYALSPDGGQAARSLTVSIEIAL